MTNSLQSNSRYLPFITLIATLGGLLFGYDTAVISGAIGNLEKYFELSSAQVGWAASSALVGCIGGALVSSLFSQNLGRKWSMIIAALLFLISAIGTGLPDSFTEFIIYRIVGGVGVGLASMLAPMYIAEIAPAHKRGQLVAYNQFAIVFGMLVVYFVNYFISMQGDDQWNVTIGWRWMFASEAIPAFLYLTLLFVVPESPRWLVMKNREQEALATLSKIGSANAAAGILAEIKESLKEKKGTYRDLLTSGLSLALLVGVLLSVFQQVTGINVFLYYAPEIFKSFGSGQESAMLQTVIVGLVNMLFTVVAIFTVDRWGRKPLLQIGAIGMGISILAIGISAYYQNLSGWLLLPMLGYIAAFALSWGPVVWVMLSEIFPNRVRSLALSVAVAAQWISNFVVSQTFPMMNRNEYLNDTFHGAFPFLLYGGMCIVALIFVNRLVPETKNKTLEELERTWKK